MTGWQGVGEGIVVDSQLLSMLVLGSNLRYLTRVSSDTIRVFYERERLMNHPVSQASFIPPNFISPNVRPLSCRLLLLAVLSIVLVSCASVPMQEMSDARQSLQAAKDVGADKYAGEKMREAERYLEEAENNLNGRVYGQARRGALSAKEAALSARRLAVTIGAATIVVDAAEINDEQRKEARLLLEQAIDAANQGMEQEAIDLAEEAKRRIEK